MPLTADSPLTASPSSSKLPASFRFSAMILDPDAGKKKKATILLALAEGNNLTFSGGAKSISQKVDIGPTPVAVSFSTRVSGDASELAAFRVSMRDEEGNDMVTTFVAVE
jgi:hypothetical protein